MHNHTEDNNTVYCNSIEEIDEDSFDDEDSFEDDREMLDDNDEEVNSWQDVSEEDDLVEGNRDEDEEWDEG